MFTKRRTRSGAAIQARPANGIVKLPPVAGVQTSFESEPTSEHGLHTIPTSSFVQIQVENTGLVAHKAIIFDAGGQYQLDTGEVNHADLDIRGIGKDYQALQNRIARYDLQVHRLHMEILQGNVGQFDNRITIFKSTAASNNVLPWQEYYPIEGRRSNQYQLTLVELERFNVLFEHSTAMVVDINPGTIVAFRFFLAREWGRTQ